MQRTPDLSINNLTEDRPLFQTTRRPHSLSCLNTPRKLALAIANTINAASPAIGTLTFMRLFPNTAPVAAGYILAASNITMLIGAGVSIADMTETERLRQLRLLWKSITNGFGAYMFSFESSVGLFVSIARLMGYSDDDINNGLANIIAFAVLTTTSVALGCVHAGVKYKNDRTRNQVAKYKKENPFDESSLPKESTSFLVFENATNIVVIGAALHTLWMNIEALIEDENLNSSPGYELPRYLVPLAIGAVTFVINSLFKHKPAALINEFITDLNSINIAMLLGSLLKAGMPDGYKMSEQERLIYMLMWPSLVAIPLLYKLGEIFLNRCKQNAYVAINDLEANIGDDYYRNSSNESEAAEQDETVADRLDTEAVIGDHHDSDSSEKHDTSESDDTEDEKEDTVSARPVARQVPRNTLFFIDVDSRQTVAGDLHVVKRFN